MDKTWIENNLKIAINLEWLGVRFEDTKDIKGEFGLPKTAYYYSVPESSVITLDDQELNSRIQTAHGLKLLAKERILNMNIDALKKVYPDEEDFIEDVTNNSADYFQFYAKVRVGEVWNEEMANKRMEELLQDIQNAAAYKEV